eukprot:11304113-Prorocentrum_lima.AAC.1
MDERGSSSLDCTFPPTSPVVQAQELFGAMLAHQCGEDPFEASVLLFCQQPDEDAKTKDAVITESVPRSPA